VLYAADCFGQGVLMGDFLMLVDGYEYTDWKTMRITRSLENATSDFEVTVSERFWQILPGATCELRMMNETVLTGYVDAYRPKYGPTAHDVTVTGRSKTCDFVDSSVLFETDGQFKNMTPGQLARTLAAPFKIEVLSEFDGEPIPDAQVQQGETCFALLERLCRLQEILVTDDAQGRLVLARASNRTSATVLVEGGNILGAGAELDDSERFSIYLVKAQLASNRAYDDFGQTGDVFAYADEGAVALPIDGRSFADERKKGGKRKSKAKAVTQIVGQAEDLGVTRYRPHVIVAEGQADSAEAQKRADFEARRRLARAKTAEISVQGWRQGDGALWTQNLNIWVESPWLGLSQSLLIKEVEFNYGSGGETTTLTLCMPDSLLPEPKRKTKEPSSGKKKAAGGGGKDMWSAVIKGSGQ
jgi:prophage tail gpP-like protein